VSKQARQEALRALIDASQGRTFEAGLIGETSRWAEPAYRRSPDAALSLDSGTGVRLSPDAVRRLEDGIAALRSIEGPRTRWLESDLWAIVASMVATLPPDLKVSRLQVELSRRLGVIEDPGPGVVCFVLRGATWTSPARTIGQMVLGRAGKEFRAELDRTAGKRPTPLPDRKKGWMSRVRPEGSSRDQAPLVGATWVQSSHRQAVRDARTRLQDLIHVSLLFRGAVDEGTVRSLRLLNPDPVDLDVVAPMVARDRFGDARLPEPPPTPLLALDDLLEIGVSHGLVHAALSTASPLAWRCRMAARMHARALSAIDPAEGILALWTAFDALLGDGSASPDKAISNRFALLHGDRRGVEDGYAWLVGQLREARVAAAHGHHSSRLEGFDLVIDGAERLRWAASRLWSVLVNRGTAREADYADLFKALKAALAGG
jgi:hypothetical protein